MAVRHLWVGGHLGRINCFFRDHSLGRRPVSVVRARERALAEVDATGSRSSAGHATLYTVQIIIRGSMLVALPGSRLQRLHSGDYLVVSGVEAGQIRTEPSADLLECGAFVDEWTGARLAEAGVWDTRLHAGHCGVHLKLLHDFKRFYEDVTDMSVERPFLIRRLAMILQTVAEGAAGAEDQKFRRQACLLILMNCGPSVRLSNLASEMNMSYSSFRSRFRALMGVSPAQFQMRVRMEKACSLLQTRGVGETASELGYTDPHVFSRQFRQVMGASPRVWRKGSG
jgi:AraC-like DNA-binding protein